jgi:hypothetical protein
MGAVGGCFALLSFLLAIPGIVLLVVGGSWLAALGLVLVALAVAPAVVGIALAVSSAVSRWAAPHKLFA